MKYQCSYCGAKAEQYVSFCPWCSRHKTFGPSVTKEVVSVPVESVLKTSRDLYRVQCGEGVCELLGGWDGCFPVCVLVHGLPSSGKTTLCLIAAHRFFPSALYVSGEEGLSDTLARKIRRLELVSEDVHILGARRVSDVLHVLDDLDVKAVVFDSVSVMGVSAADVEALKARGLSVWLIAHEVKSGESYRGDSWLGHISDVTVRVVKVDDQGVHCEVEKSRFGVLKDCVVG